LLAKYCLVEIFLDFRYFLKISRSRLCSTKISKLSKDKRFNFKSEINDPSIRQIFAMSDLHGDLFGTIIMLRDCCKVIKKKEDHPFSQMEIDKEIKDYLEMDLNSSSYVNDLNYEWIGGNSHVVICGDIIDNFRKDDNDPTKPDAQGMYFLEEIKLLKFLNAIDEQAQTFGGKIIKLCGNHDFNNLFSSLIFLISCSFIIFILSSFNFSISCNNFFFILQNC
jgi:hypothetical protein